MGTTQWKDFEILVAAAHQAAEKDATVEWNKIINGRQFDVFIERKSGAYSLVSLIECKDYKRPVSVSEIEAFVTKYVDANGHHGVVASKSGFTSGAKNCAAKHNISLCNVTEEPNSILEDLGVPIVDKIFINNMYDICLVHGNKKTYLPDENGFLDYITSKIFFKRNSGVFTFKKVIDNYLEGIVVSDTELINNIDISEYIVSSYDSCFPLEENYQYLQFKCKEVEVGRYGGSNVFDPSMLLPDIALEDVMTGEKSIYKRRSLKLNTLIKPKTFYRSPIIDKAYYCLSVANNIANIWLIEGFAGTRKIEVKFTAKISEIHSYVEITDKSTLKRLECRARKVGAIR